MAIEDR